MTGARTLLWAVLAACALGPPAGAASGGGETVPGGLANGSAGGARLSGGAESLGGCLGQAGPAMSNGSVQAQGGYFGGWLVPPDPVTDLSAAQDGAIRTSSISWITLSFTSRGENAAGGALQAGALYDVRWATFPLTSQAVYLAAGQQKLFPAAGPAQSPVSLPVGVTPGYAWYFGLTTINSAGMRSAVSNAASAPARKLQMLADNIAPLSTLENGATAFLRVRLWTDAGAGSMYWTGLDVGKSGTLGDASVQGVAIFRDANANGAYDGADIQVSPNAVFASSRASLGLNGAMGELINNSTRTYFVAAALQYGELLVEGSTIAVFLNGNAFTVTGGGVGSPDLPGLGFNGADAGVAAPDFDIGIGLTLEGWLRAGAVSGALLEKAGAGCATGFCLTVAGGALTLITNGNTLSGGSVADGRWHHFAATYDSASGRRLFVDGVTVAQAGTSVLADVAAGLAVGRDDYGAGSGFWSGDLDEIRVSTFARYAHDFIPQRRPGTDAGTFILYHFDAGDLAQGRAADASGSGRHGTMQGGLYGAGLSSATSVMGMTHTVQVLSADISSSAWFRGQTDAPALKLQLWTDAGYATIEKLSVARSGSSLDSDVSAARVWLDDGDGVFEPALDSDLTGGELFVGGVSTFDFAAAGAPQLIGTTPRTYFLTLDLSPSAAVPGSLGLVVGATDAFVLTGSTNTVSPAGFPLGAGPDQILATWPNVTTDFATGTWLDAASVVFRGAFGQGNVSYYRRAWNQSADYTVTAGDTQWSVGNATMTPASGGTWYFHVRGYDSAHAAGSQQDFEFWIDRSSPSASAFASLSSTGGALGEVQWNKLIAGTTARLTVQDVWSGLSLDTGSFTARFSTDAGNTWTLVTDTGGAPPR
ncbi:MAG: LamG domain-containing protein, partial [Elusimicrobia bacterium]|nr:LamG domain-containing protein [Elusimicrobiota bacterium]